LLRTHTSPLRSRRSLKEGYNLEMSIIVKKTSLVVSGENITVRGGGVTVTGERRDSRVKIPLRSSYFFN